MKMKILFSSLVFTTALLTSCDKNPSSDSEKKDSLSLNQEDTKLKPKEGVLIGQKYTLRALKDSPTFPESKLTIASPSTGQILDAGSVDFQFKVIDGEYQLGSQTSDADNKSCSNSAKGQHIHLILNNKPYEAVYGENYTTKAQLEEGNHVVLAFISRSYHESLKHKEAYVLSQFQVGDKVIQDPIDLSAQHLFYSRPKGSYNISEASKIFLDFYLVNTEISAGNNYVRVAIDGDEFKITSWEPYIIEGLKAGVHTIKIQLYDKDGNYIEGPFNTTERTFTVTQ